MGYIQGRLIKPGVIEETDLTIEKNCHQQSRQIKPGKEENMVLHKEDKWGLDKGDKCCLDKRDKCSRTREITGTWSTRTIGAYTKVKKTACKRETFRAVQGHNLFNKGDKMGMNEGTKRQKGP